jgi:hypothetical protein
MNDDQLLELAQQILDGPDKVAAASLVDATAEAMYRQLGEVIARKMLRGEKVPTRMVMSEELLSILAPKEPAPIDINIQLPEQPKRKSRTIVTRHDAKGRITEFEQETLP